MNILFLVSSMHAGGAERVASTLTNAWASRGDRVTLMPTFSCRGDCFYPLSSAVHLVYLTDLVSSRSRTWFDRVARLRTLRRFIIAEHPDIIVSFLSNVNVAAIIAAAGLGIPVIACERTDPFIKSPASSLSLWLAFRLIYPRVDVLMVQTQAVAAKYAKLHWAPKRVRVIQNPIPEEMMNIQHQPSVNAKKCVLSVGRLEDDKQFDVLIKVFAGMAARYENWTLRIIGEGSMRPVLQRQIINLGLQGRVELPGRSKDIGEEFAKADIFVLTSRREGFPNALLEAMTVGLPCVSFDCPSGPREMSEDGKVALLVPLNDERTLGLTLEQLMSDEDLRRSLGRRARASVLERFVLEKVLARWDLLFKEVGINR